MKKSTLTWIALKYFRSKKETGLVSFTSWVSIIGIGLGAFALVITLSVLNGFENEIAERVINIESHLKITGKNITDQTVQKVSSIANQHEFKMDKISPFVTRKAILSSNGINSAIRLKGIDKLSKQNIFTDRQSIMRGSSDFSSESSDMPGILLGFRLADKLGLFIGDTVNIINPTNIGGTVNIPYVGQFRLAGVYRLDLFDYDNGAGFVEISEARRIFRMGQNYSGIDITFDNYSGIENKQSIFEKELKPDLLVKSWEELHKSLFGAMKLEKYGSFIALSFIVLVAIFNLTSSLVMMVMEKINEIGMLQALGMNRKQLKTIFLRLGFFTGSIGLGTGIILSSLICYIQQVYKIIPLPSVYFIPYVPVEIKVIDIILIMVTGLILIYLGTLYPSKKASSLVPLEAINYEK
ncbi:MAG: ABC transporter permease [Candidatus Marinimicrobia bacterium]|nr:ABC transporter permease [Candidatus Neomarinimicrobiota bacterium]